MRRCWEENQQSARRTYERQQCFESGPGLVQVLDVVSTTHHSWVTNVSEISENNLQACL